MTLSDEEIDAIAERVLIKLTDALRLNVGANNSLRHALGMPARRSQPLDAVGVTDLRTGKVTIRET